MVGEISNETKELLDKATEVYSANFKNTSWFGRCIFISWYCDVGTCKFCFRATQKSRIKHAEKAKRSIGSILLEPLFAKIFNWRIEFLTGGYRIFPEDELVKIAELVSKVYGERVWLNLGALSEESLKKFLPYIEGVCGSIETADEKLHDKICPDKKIKPYFDMFELDMFKSLKKSITIVIGLGEKKEDFEKLANMIEKLNLDRITFYALKPVQGTPFEKGPSTDDYLWWISQTRIKFPKLEIIAGTTPRRYMEAGLLMKAGANAITKFPATKLFGTEKAHTVENEIEINGREFASNLTDLPDIDFEEEIDKLDIDEEYKKEMKEKLPNYLRRMKNNLSKV